MRTYQLRKRQGQDPRLGTVREYRPLSERRGTQGSAGKADGAVAPNARVVRHRDRAVVPDRPAPGADGSCPPLTPHQETTPGWKHEVDRATRRGCRGTGTRLRPRAGSNGCSRVDERGSDVRLRYQPAQALCRRIVPRDRTSGRRRRANCGHGWGSDEHHQQSKRDSHDLTIVRVTHVYHSPARRSCRLKGIRLGSGRCSDERSNKPLDLRQEPFRDSWHRAVTVTCCPDAATDP